MRVFILYLMLICSMQYSWAESQSDAEYDAAKKAFIARDYTTAFPVIHKRASQGDAMGQYATGQMYEQGWGIDVDYSEAIKWYTKAVKAGIPQAMNNLGLMYKKGKGVPVDLNKAVMLFKKAANLGTPEAYSNLGSIYRRQSGLEGPKMARKYFQKAANLGLTDAKYNLGAMYANGEGGSKNQLMAYVWLTLAYLEADNKGIVFETPKSVLSSIENSLSEEQLNQAKSLINEGINGKEVTENF